MIGAMELSEVCAQLERAADDGNIDTIRNRTPELLKLYDRIIGVLRYGGISGTQTQADDEILEFFPET